MDDFIWQLASVSQHYSEHQTQMGPDHYFTSNNDGRWIVAEYICINDVGWCPVHADKCCDIWQGVSLTCRFSQYNYRFLQKLYSGSATWSATTCVQFLQKTNFVLSTALNIISMADNYKINKHMSPSTKVYWPPTTLSTRGYPFIPPGTPIHSTMGAHWFHQGCSFIALGHPFIPLGAPTHSTSGTHSFHQVHPFIPPGPPIHSTKWRPFIPFIYQLQLNSLFYTKEAYFEGDI